MMNQLFFRFFLLLVFCFFSSKIGAKSTETPTSHDWVKIYYNENGRQRINAHLITEIDSIEYTSKTPADGADAFQTINVSAKGCDLFSLPVDSIISMVIGGNIPTVYIDTNPPVDDITSKTNYLEASFRYVPYGDGSEPVENTVSIRGRGNSSWLFPKKPYRLKFEKKQTIGNLNKAKNFVLLSNYIDNTLMRNALAMKIAHLIGLPYANIMLPVNLVLNGKQRGNYMLTNKLGLNSGSIDIDESEGILWEFDTNFDEEFKFISDPFALPCMVKDPDFHDLADNEEEVQKIWQYWQNDLTNAFKAVERGEWREAIDEEQFIKYFIVQTIVLNTEIEFPKSFYMYKETKDGKYMMGPCWDYDWSCGYHHDINRGILYKNCGSWDFLIPIFKEEEFSKKFKAEFNKFCDQHLDEILDFIDSYATLIRDSALADALIWPEEHYNTEYEHSERNASRFDLRVKELKDWIVERIKIVKNASSNGLYY